MYDVIVVGARCAGAPTAMLLARQGYRVLVVDRSTFPSDIMSTHYIHQAGVERLARWGLLDRVVASNCPPIRHTTLDVGPFALRGSPLAVNGVGAAYAPRRFALDTILVEAARAAGAEVREGFVVEGLVWDGDRVAGIRGHSHGGAAVTETAQVVVGADGIHSFVARQVQAPVYHEQPAMTCGYYAYWSGIPCEDIEVYMRPQRCLLAIPTNDGLTCVAAIWPHDEFHRVREDYEGYFMAAVDLAPGLAERVRAGRREERFIGTADTPNFFRQPFGPGWALVGDAGYHKDPIIGRGITDSFLDADRLARALGEGLAGRQTMPTALAAYEQERNTTMMPIYEITCQRAALEAPSPQMLGLLAALRGNQAQTDRFMSINGGTVSAADFYAPENIARIMAAAQPQLALA